MLGIQSVRSGPRVLGQDSTASENEFWFARLRQDLNALDWMRLMYALDLEVQRRLNWEYLCEDAQARTAEFFNKRPDGPSTRRLSARLHQGVAP